LPRYPVTEEASAVGNRLIRAIEFLRTCGADRIRDDGAQVIKVDLRAKASRWTLVLATSLLVASTPVSPSPHAAPMAFERSQQPLDTLPTEVLALKNPQLDPGSSRLVATWHAEGAGRAFLVRTVSGDTCIVLARLNETGAEGCNPGSDPFAGRPYFWTSSAEGGPGLSDLRAYELVGIVRDDVAHVELSDTAGMVHQAQIGSDRGFAFVFRRAELIAGDSQMRIAAYSSDGTLLGRETVRGA
jgi:hypothetical protein